MAGQEVYELLASYLESRTAAGDGALVLLPHPTVRNAHAGRRRR